MASPGDPFGYDETPYPSAPYPHSHPDHLAVMARLFGLAPARIDHCRVLEIGCADGANLIPMAATLPDSRFVGIDLSERQIDAGRGTIAQLGLPNIDLRPQDLAEFSADDGRFDFIIAHGVYSWTPPETRRRLLEVCRDRLAEQGVAFISYNVHPGWGLRSTIRDWLMSAASASSGSRVEAARPRIERLHKLLQQQGGPTTAMLASELDRLAHWNDAYLRHDLLEDHNQPVSYVEFVAQADAFQLRVFADADFASMVGADLPSAIAAELQRMTGSPLECEQLLDLVSNRAFRQSLVCHRDRCPRELIDLDAVRSLHVASLLHSDDCISTGTSAPVCFGAGGLTIDVADPLAVTGLRLLAGQWPLGMFFTDLIGEAREELAASGTVLTDDQWRTQADALATVLLTGFAGRCVLLRSQPAPFTKRASDRPMASSLARLQAEQRPLVTNLRHDPVRLDEPARRLLQLLDGERDRDELARLWSAVVPAADEQGGIERVLARLANSALLLQ